MVCENLKFKITVYFVTCVHRSILNIVSIKLYHESINKKKDRDAYYLQNINRVGQFFYILTVFIYSFILAAIIVIYLSVVIIYGNLLKYIAVTAQLLQWKLGIIPL